MCAAVFFFFFCFLFVVVFVVVVVVVVASACSCFLMHYFAVGVAFATADVVIASLWKCANSYLSFSCYAVAVANDAVFAFRLLLLPLLLRLGLPLPL